MSKHEILRLVPNKNKHYPGGRELDRFRGIDSTDDDNRPEAWVGSATRVLGEAGNAGMAQALMPDLSKILVRDLLSNEPVWYLGSNHVSKWGSDPALLVKLLDAGGPLTLQCHPSGVYAKSHFNSSFGKQESWYVLSVRQDTHKPPYIILGFKPGITRSTFEHHYYSGNTAALENLCHYIPVKPGDMFIVPPGVPHAIGAGCFLAEVQEPSDITVFAVKERNENHDTALGCFDYTGRSKENNLKAFKVNSVLLKNEKEATIKMLLGPEQTNCFSITKANIRTSISHHETGSLQIAIVTEGKGSVKWSDGTMSIQKGDELLIAAEARNVKWIADGSLEVLFSHPPGADIINNR